MEQKNVRLRTIDEAHAEIIKMDPDSKITKYFIRTLVKNGTIPCLRVGKKKRLINLDLLIEYLSNPFSFEGRGYLNEWYEKYIIKRGRK